MVTVKKAQNGIAKYSDPKPLLDSLANVKKNIDAKKALLNTKYLDNQRRFNESKSNLSKKKNGGSVKAKDGKWMQKAAASIKKRGTKGVCTGAKFGGPTCKPGTKRYALAKTFRKISKKK